MKGENCLLDEGVVWWEAAGVVEKKGQGNGLSNMGKRTCSTHEVSEQSWQQVLDYFAGASRRVEPGASGT